MQTVTDNVKKTKPRQIHNKKTRGQKQIKEHSAELPSNPCVELGQTQGTHTALCKRTYANSFRHIYQQWMTFCRQKHKRPLELMQTNNKTVKGFKIFF